MHKVSSRETHTHGAFLLDHRLAGPWGAHVLPVSDQGTSPFCSLPGDSARLCLHTPGDRVLTAIPVSWELEVLF